MGILENKKANQEAKKYVAVSPTSIAQGSLYRPLLMPVELFGKRKIRLGRKNGVVKAPHSP